MITYPKTVGKEIVLVVEGRDDKKFISSLAKFLSLDQHIQIIDIEGVMTFPKLQAVVSLPEFSSKVKSFGVIRDADLEYDSAVQSVTNFMSKLNLPFPTKGSFFAKDARIKTGIYVLPGLNQAGMLESLIVSSLSAQFPEYFQCVDAYISCLNKSGHFIGKLDKIKTHAFLAAYREPGISVGDAALKNYWDWTNQNFNELRDFLIELSK